MNIKSLHTQKLRRFAIAGLAAGLLGATSSFAQGEDEWYDPTDWFDGNNIESDDTYSYSAYDYDYDYGFDDTYEYGTDWSDYHSWGSDRWEADYYDADYWDDYDWSDSSITANNMSSSSSKAKSSSTSGSNSKQSNNNTKNSSDQSATDGAIVYTFTVFALPTDGQQAKPTSSQQQGSAKKQQQSGSKQSKRSQADQQQVTTLSGTIEGLRSMKLKQPSGATGTYTIANIRLENGKNTIVNLGRSSRLEDVQLEKGDSIQALGRKGKIAGKTVFVAHKLKANGKTIDANPVIRLADRQTAQNQKQKTIQGTVQDISQSSSRAQNNHTLLNLQLENGQSATVDLGPAASLEQIDLQEGETVTVRGHTQQMEGREILVPDLMKVEGQKISSVSE